MKKRNLLKKIASGVLAAAMTLPCGQMAMAEEAYNDGKEFTISVLCEEPASGVGAADMWWFKYAEWYMQQNGYNVKFDVQGAVDTDQAKALVLATNNIPDLVWGIPLSSTEAVIYGQNDGVILDWTPYLNETNMPNTYESMNSNLADAFVLNTTPDGKIYGLPYGIERGWCQAAGNAPGVNRGWINQSWLDEVGMENPTTLDELLDVLRAFKNEIKLEDGSEVIPLASVIFDDQNSSLTFYQLMFMYLGFYGTTGFNHGNEPAIKDGEIVLPCYTEEMKEMLTVLNTMYTEGLISQDFCTMDTDTANALAASGRVGVWAGNLFNFNPENYTDWVSLNPLTSSNNDFTITSNHSPYQISRVWASAETEHPEALAFLMDFLYSQEGQAIYMCGLPEGEDPLGIISGYSWDEEKQQWSNTEIESGEYDSIATYQFNVLAPCIYIGDNTGYMQYMYEKAGVDMEVKYDYMEDPITKETIEMKHNVEYNDSNLDGYYRLSQAAAWDGHITTICLPEMYCSDEVNQKLTDLKTVIDAYVQENIAKFVVGSRSLDEFDQYMEELKAMGIEDELEIYREGYASYMENYFGE